MCKKTWDRVNPWESLPETGNVSPELQKLAAFHVLNEFIVQDANLLTALEGLFWLIIGRRGCPLFVLARLAPALNPCFQLHRKERTSSRVSHLAKIERAEGSITVLYTKPLAYLIQLHSVAVY
jgi:hypothetical protein